MNYTTKREGQYLRIRAAGMPTIATKNWIAHGHQDPPELELKLTDGRFIKVHWDFTASLPIVMVAQDCTDDYYSPGFPVLVELSPILGEACDEVEEAARHHADELAMEAGDTNGEPLHVTMGWTR